MVLKLISFKWLSSCRPWMAKMAGSPVRQLPATGRRPTTRAREPRQSIFTKFCGLIWQAVAGQKTLVCEWSPGSGGALVCILVEIQFGGGGRGGGVPWTLDISYLVVAGVWWGLTSQTNIFMSKSGKDIRPSTIGRPLISEHKIFYLLPKVCIKCLRIEISRYAGGLLLSQALPNRSAGAMGPWEQWITRRCPHVWDWPLFWILFLLPLRLRTKN